MGDGGGSGFGLRAGGRRLAGIVLSAAIVLTIAILAVQGGKDDEEIDTAPRIVEVSDLSALADSLGHPLYWAGPRPEDRLELSEEVGGSIYLRYLPAGVEAGDPRAAFLTVGTYLVAGAQAALRRTAAETGSRLGHSAGGGLVLVNPAEPRSVYLAYPGSDLQLEVYDPAPGRALSLIRAGAVRPVD